MSPPVYTATQEHTHTVFTLDDGQQDDDDEEEEGDVKDHAVKFVFIPGRILDLVSDSSSGTDSNVHVEQVTLGKWVSE